MFPSVTSKVVRSSCGIFFKLFFFLLFFSCSLAYHCHIFLIVPENGRMGRDVVQKQ